MKNFVDTIANSDVILLMLTAVIGLVVLVITTTLAYKSKNKIDIFAMKSESEEISKAVKNIQFAYNIENEKSGSQNADKNVINMMTDNVSELREYYVISKQQARKSFSAALFICFFGIIIYLLGIISYMIFNKDILVISIVGGTVVEVISGLFFWLYREATKQLGVYHQRLGSTEKYLIVIQIIRELPEDKRAEIYRNLIFSLLSDNKKILSLEEQN